MQAEEIAYALPRGKRIGPDKYLACCCAHADKNPSLSITQAQDKVLVKCWAGCSQSEVIEALKSRGLWRSKQKTDRPRFTLSQGQIIYMKAFVLIYYHDVARAISEGLEPEQIMKLHTDEEKRKAREFSRMLKAQGIKI